MSANQVAGGHKANLNNPKTSEESKDNSRQILDEMESSGQLDQTNDSSNKNEGNVVGGHKANLKNSNTSEESKDHSRDVLREHGVDA
ncbi:hypothetical protein SCHPADRAFT_939543 [Schizopora paradoxa]|uniref:Conidiation protein 6 n=1 Tax=Schizopora paradoxa TaxID=27342 RepID=A0A0H2RYD1_9AGAM|nr:hypothetical protein SCHPADRAFT_939543 [Schizopora paradoxa]